MLEMAEDKAWCNFKDKSKYHYILIPMLTLLLLVLSLITCRPAVLPFCERGKPLVITGEPWTHTQSAMQALWRPGSALSRGLIVWLQLLMAHLVLVKDCRPSCGSFLCKELIYVGA